MKKNGFTLAEVLITLAIIGVVATLTLPALMTNTAEQQYKTAFKKGLNTLTIAAETNDAVDGFDFSGVSVKSEENKTDASEIPSLYAMLATRGAVDYKLSKVGSTMPKVAKTDTTGNFCVYFRDGSVLMFKDDAGISTTSDEKKIQDDGLPYGIKAVYDVNGPKLPNVLSNCSTNSQMSSDSPTSDNDKTCTKTTRVIKDRFGVRLRGHYAVPNGAAARWAAEN